MSKRSERREAERIARKLAYQQSRQQKAQTAAVQLNQPELIAAAPEPATIPDALLAKAKAFFERPIAQQESKPEAAAAPAPNATQPKPIAISDAQLAANRANAQLSTGPTSAAGLAISSRNNTRHGLSGDIDGDNFRVLGNESQALYDQELAGYRKEWKPNTATEHDLVNRMVIHRWLRKRALRLQESLFDPQTGTLTDPKQFELYRRYEAHHHRGYNRAFTDLQRLRAFRQREQNGFESQRRKDEEHAIKIRILQARENQLLLKLAKANPPTRAAASSQCPLPPAALPSQPPASPTETAHG